MRQINIVLPDQDVKRVLDIAESSDLKAAHVRSAGEIDLVIITVPDDQVDDFISRLKDAGIDKTGTISILPIHAAISDKEKDKVPTIAPKEEIIESARRACSLTRGYVFMIVISAFVATLGLMMNSTAVVIGAMVIAPLLGPSIAASVGTVMGDTALFRKGIMSTTLGLLIVIIAAALTAAFVNSLQLLPSIVNIRIEELPSEIKERTSLNILIVGLALASGAAGAYSFAEKKGEILVGVMIAVALVPPAAIVGIGIALLDMEFIISSGLLLAVNVICINIAKDVKKRLFITMIILIILGAVFSWTTFIAYHDNQLEKRIAEEIDDLIEDEDYPHVISYEVDEIRLGRNLFGMESDEPVFVAITIYSDDPYNCSKLNIATNIKQVLEVKFRDEIDKGFDIDIIFQAMDTSR
jgi:uncharacterized hydrophobic protein (TIGR00341 family)